MKARERGAYVYISQAVVVVEVCVTVEVVTTGLPAKGAPATLVIVTVGETVTVLTDVTVEVGKLRHEHALVMSRAGYSVMRSGIGGRSLAPG